MRRFMIVAAVIIAGGFFASEGIAAVVSITATVSQVRSACSSVGGSFGVHMDGGGYGCVKENCDGKGGKCQVQCTNNNSCTGTYPGRAVSNGIEGSRGGMMGGILTNGTGVKTGTSGSAAPAGNILGSSPSMGASGPSATGNPVDKPKMPAPAPIPQIR